MAITGCSRAQSDALDNSYRDQAGVRGVAKPLTSNPKEIKFEYLTEIHGVKIIMTDHAKKQARERHGMPLDTMRRFFEDMEPVWGNIPIKEYNQEVFVYSVKYQRGMILAFRRDFKNDERVDLAMVVVTVYPYGKAVPMQRDTLTYRG
jgi:hypothetical protein